MTIKSDGFILWEAGESPFKKRAFAFSPQSARLAYDQYKAVRGYLIYACRLPDGDYEGVKVIRAWLQSPDSKAIRSPFTVYLTAEEWHWVSRALRDWSSGTEASRGYEYQTMVRAKRHGKEASNVQ